MKKNEEIDDTVLEAVMTKGGGGGGGGKAVRVSDRKPSPRRSALANSLFVSLVFNKAVIRPDILIPAHPEAPTLVWWSGPVYINIIRTST